LDKGQALGLERDTEVCVVSFAHTHPTIEELPKNNGEHNAALQNRTATRTSVRMEQPVRKMLHISHTSANVHLRLPENTVKPVSSPFCSFIAHRKTVTK